MAPSRRRLESPDLVACLSRRVDLFPFSFLYYFPGPGTDLGPLEFSSSLHRRSELPSRGGDSRMAAGGFVLFRVFFIFLFSRR